MSKPIKMSMQTRKNWLIFLVVFLGAVISILSGIYFLLVPSGGYQGGRNELYGLTILFERHTWEELHTWGGLLMITAVVVHFAIHWGWVKSMTRRVGKSIRLSGGGKFSKGAKVNVAVDAVIAISFLITALSGIYFLFVSSGGFEGGRNVNWEPNFLFSRTTWDLIHTWAAVVLIVAAVLHFYIHWGWITKVTVRFFRSLLPQAEAEIAQTTR